MSFYSRIIWENFGIIKNANASYIQSRINVWKFLLQRADVNEKIDLVNECLKKHLKCSKRNDETFLKEN